MTKRANKEGTLYKKTINRNGVDYIYWTAQLTVDYDPLTGKRIRKTITGKTQKEVKQKMQTISSSIADKTFFEPSEMPLSRWIDIWLSEYCSHVKYQTKKHYIAQCDTHIKPMIGQTKLSELSTPQLQKFYNALSQTGRTITKRENGKRKITHEPLSPKSIKNIHGILSKCLNTAVDLGYIRINPASRVNLPIIERKEINPLTNEQVKTFLKLIETDQYKNIFKLILFTGLRESEAIGLTWDCVDTESNILTINKQLQRRPQRDGGYTFAPLKNDKPRILSVPQFVIDSILNEPRIENEKNLVFLSKMGTPIDPRYLYYHYKRIASQMGIPQSRVHDLRHTYAVLALQNGDEIKTVQSNLGHATAAFTLDVYGHTTDLMKEMSAKRMQNFIDTLKK